MAGFILALLAVLPPSLRLIDQKSRTLEYPELGMEAVWRIEVEDFPGLYHH